MKLYEEDIMKKERQAKIKDLVSMYDISTQEELIQKLCDEGIDATQATVSRDIRELRLLKIPTGYGGFRYSLSPSKEKSFDLKFSQSLAESMVDVDFSGNIVLIHTFPGLASAVAASIDASKTSEILGCVAGDDTIIVVVRTPEAAETLCEKIKILIKA